MQQKIVNLPAHRAGALRVRSRLPMLCYQVMIAIDNGIFGVPMKKNYTFRKNMIAHGVFLTITEKRAAARHRQTPIMKAC